MNRYDDGELVSKIIRRISLEESVQARPMSPASRCMERPSMKMWNEYNQMESKKRQFEKRLIQPRSISEASTVLPGSRRRSIFGSRKVDTPSKSFNEDQNVASTKNACATSERAIKKANSDEDAKSASSSNSFDKSTGHAYDDINQIMVSPREVGTSINSEQSKPVGSTTDKRNKKPVLSAAMGPVDLSKERPSGGSSKRETRKRQTNDSRYKKPPVTPITTNGSRRAQQNSERTASGDIDQPPASPMSAREGDMMFGAEEKTKPKPRPLSPVSRAIDVLGAEEKTKPRIRPLSPVPRAIESSAILSPRNMSPRLDQSPDPKRAPGASTKRDTRRRQILDSKHKKRPVTPITVPGTRRLIRASTSTRTSTSTSDADADVLVPPTSPTSKREVSLPRRSSEDRSKFKKRIMATPPRSIESSSVVTPKYIPVEQRSDPRQATSTGKKRPVSSVTRAVEKPPPAASFKSPILTSQTPISSSPSLPRVASVSKLSPKGASSSRRGRKFKRPYDFMSPPGTPGVMDRRRDLGRLVKSAPIPDAVRRSRLLQPRYRCRSSRTVRKRLVRATQSMTPFLTPFRQSPLHAFRALNAHTHSPLL